MTTARVRDYAIQEAARFGCRAGDVFNRTRAVAHDMARKAVMRRLVEDGFSHSQIAVWMNRDRSTIGQVVGARK